MGIYGYLIKEGGNLSAKYFGKKYVTDTTGRAVLKRELPLIGGMSKYTSPEYLKAAGMILGGSALGFWAGTNVYQTGIISQDKEEELEYQKDYLDYQKDNLQWQRDKFEAEELARQEDYEHGLLQTGLIEAFDIKNRQFQASQSQAQMNYETAMYNAKLRQMNNDRNTYLANQAFQTFTGGRMTPKDDQYTIAFILTELINLKNQGKEEVIDQPDLDPYYEPNYEDFENFSEYNLD